MVTFELKRVLGDWLTATYAPDDIEYWVVVGGDAYDRWMYRLQEIVAFYECVVDEIPTADHASRTMHELVARDDSVEFVVRGRRIETTYQALREPTARFLRQIFGALDECSDSQDKERAFRRLNGLTERGDLHHAFGATYRRVAD